MRRTIVSSALAVLFIVTALPRGEARLAAQDTRLSLDVGVSHARPPSGVEAEDASYLLGGARLQAGPLFGSIYGAMGPDAESASWVSGTLGTNLRVALANPLWLGLTTYGSAFAVGDPTSYRAATLRVVPEVRVQLDGGPYLALRGHGGLGTSNVEVTEGPDGSVSSDLWVYGGGLELGARLADLHVQGGVDAYDSEQGEYAVGRLAGALQPGRSLWRLELRVWDTPADLETEVHLSVSVPLGGRFSAELAGGRSGPDPLLDLPAAVNGSVVVSWHALRPGVPGVPLYTVRERAGTVTFRLELDGAGRVAVMGDFSRWNPVELSRADGVWQGRVTVEPGVYHFGFLVDGEWYVPEDAPGRVVDEYGRVNATLVMPAVTSGAGKSSDG